MCPLSVGHSLNHCMFTCCYNGDLWWGSIWSDLGQAVCILHCIFLHYVKILFGCYAPDFNTKKQLHYKYVQISNKHYWTILLLDLSNLLLWNLDSSKTTVWPYIQNDDSVKPFWNLYITWNELSLTCLISFLELSWCLYIRNVWYIHEIK